ncbi:Neprilysin [Podosphaera aphanis]|nr:Neprilysin [Podosphaera aphanis]
MRKSEDENLHLLTQSTIDSDDTKFGWKSLRSWLSRRLVWTSVIALLALVFVLVAYNVGKQQGAKSSPNSNLCATPACMHASSEILYNLSPQYKSIDPCTNFGELVCGGWDDRHDIRPDRGDASTASIMSENAEILLRHILEAPSSMNTNQSSFVSRQFHSSLSRVKLDESSNSIDTINFQKLKNAYDACMDTATIKNRGIEPLMEMIHRIVKLFPVQWENSKKAPPTTSNYEGLSETIIFFQSLGISGLIDVDVGPDDKNPDDTVVLSSPPVSIGLPSKNHYEDEAVLKNYTITLAQILSNLNLDYQKNSVAPQSKQKSTRSNSKHVSRKLSLASEVVEFEKELAAASPDATDRVDVTISLSKIVNSLTPQEFTAQNLIIASPNYMKNLTDILNRSSREIVQTYFIWKCIQSFSLIVEAHELKPYSRFMNELQGKDPDSVPDRWRRCVGHVNKGLGWILSRFYVEKAFSERAKFLGDEIVSDIKETFVEKLKNAPWMDQSVIEKAIEKVSKIKQKIGYPTKSPNIMDPQSLSNFYAHVNITSTNFFENTLSLAHFEVSRRWSALGKPVDRDEWSMTVPTVNAYYNAPGNEIVFPAGILQFPVFEVDLPHYLNYGSFGSIVGHELSHAFDSSGRHYNENGNYTDWWNNNTVTHFEQRAQCFIDQYAKYTIPGPNDQSLHINGKLTLGENIADAGGIAASFSAWKKRQAETSAQGLPGLEHFTPEQLFYVSFGNWWCGSSRKEAAISRIYSDPHAPNWVRILGTIENSRDFKESFNCPVQEPMCELW